MIKLAIFDLDGTLLDTLEDLYLCMNEMLCVNNLPKVDRERVKNSIGDGAKKFVENCLPNCEIEKLDYYYNLYIEILLKNKQENTKLFDGEITALKNLKAQGIKLAILTNKPQQATVNIVNTMFNFIKFDYICGIQQGFLPKPDISSIKLVADNFSFNKDEIVMIGDGEPDYLVSKYFGCKGISALWGYRTKEQLLKVGAKNFADTFADLTDLILNNKI